MSPRCFLPSFKSISLSVQEKKRKIDFQDGSYFGYLIGIILATFDLQVTRCFLLSFESIGLSVQEKRQKNRFSRWRLGPSWISDQNDFSYFFLSISHPDASYQVPSQLAFWFSRRSKRQIFKMAAMVAILDCRLGQF